MREPSVDWMSQEINARIAASAGAMTCKEDDDDERQDDGGSRAKQIERKRQRQVVALAKAMRAGRDCEHAEPNERGAECENPPASAWNPTFGTGPPVLEIASLRSQ